MLLMDVLGISVPFLTLFPAVILAAWLGGFGPSVLAAILSVFVACFLLVPPMFHFALATPEDFGRTVTFFLFSLMIGALIEEMRRARRDAERSRDLLQVTLASIGDAVIAADAKGRITFLNQLASDLTGWLPADATGRPATDVFAIQHEDSGLPIECPIGQAIRDRKAVTLSGKAVLVHRAGRRIPIENTASPIAGPRGRLFGAVLVFRDVSERRRSENALKQKEERLKLALEAGNIGAWDWDVSSDRIEWSDQVYAIHRIERGTLPGRLEEYAQLIHPADRDRVAEAIRKTLRENAPYEISFRILRPTGEIRWITTLGLVVRNGKGEPIRMLGAVTDITRQKRAETELRQQWHTFDTVLSNTPDHLFVLDRNCRFTYANHALLSLWRRSLEDVVGKNFFELDYPVDLASRVTRQVDEVIQTARPVRDQTSFTGPSGESRYYEYILVPAFDPDGGVNAVAGSSRDITGRIQTEKELRESEARLRFALEAGGSVDAWDWDLRDDAHAAPFEQFVANVHPDDRPRVAASMRSACESGGTFAEEYRILHPEGVRWVFAKGRCHVDESGKPLRLPGVAFDITDRKLAAENLRESQQRLRAIYDGTYEYIGLLSPDGELLEANRSSLEFAQSTREELIERKFWDTPWFAYTPGAAEAARDAVARAAAGEFVRYETSIVSPSGEVAAFDISLHPIRNEQGEVILIVPEGRDITALKEAEADLRQANVELTRVNRDLEQFAYVASHDLRESLRMINAYTQLLLKNFASGDAREEEYANAVRQGVTRMDTLLRNLLDFSRATMHAGDAPVGSADLAISLDDAVSDMRGRIEESGASIEIATPLPAVRGETTQMSHVFQNLVGNAIKYRREGVAPRIAVAAEWRDGEWIVSVADNGIGFEPGQARGIFEFFQRLHRDKYEGSGLGLAICKRIVERYGGRIWADSVPGEGSVFYLAMRPAATKQQLLPK